MYNGYRIIFDEKGEWNFGKDSARNVIIFGVDNNSLYHNDNPKNNFCVLDEGPTYDINGSFGTSVKNSSISFSKEKTQFCLKLDYNHDNSYLFVNEKEIYKLKTDNKNVNPQT